MKANWRNPAAGAWRAFASGVVVAWAFGGWFGGVSLRADDRSAAVAVFATVAPHAELVSAVGGDRVAVSVLVGPGQDPHHFSMTPSQVLALSKSKAYFMAGMPFEVGQSERIRSAHPDLELVYLGKGIELREIEDHCHEHDAEAGDGADADHSGHDHELDPHIWLSPPLLKLQAGTICETLCRLDPAGADAYRKNLTALEAKLDALHEELGTLLEPVKGSTFYVFHPAFGYFAEAYGLRQKAVETGGKKPTPKQLLALIKQARADNVHTIFIQPGFDHTAAQRVADEIGGSVKELDPLARGLFENLRTIGRTLAESAPKR